MAQLQQLAVSKGNEHGTRPSRPGEPPRAGTGFGRKNIIHEHDRNIPASRVGVMKNAIYMAWLDLGIRPRRIRAKKRFLRIPWRPPEGGTREPTEQEKKEIGLSLARLPGRRGKQWVYYRRQVRHPGVKPRPWIVATLLRFKDQIGRLAASEYKGR